MSASRRCRRETGPLSLRFLGATNTVTGSKFLLENGNQRVLVDCGLFQGYKQLRLKNRRPLPFVPADLDHVILTHAHLDHSGYVPVLVRDGYAGLVQVTAATAALCRHLLPDAGFIQEKDARFANRHGFSRHHPARALYTRDDAVACLPRFRVHPFGETIGLGQDVKACFSRSGHIPGAASVRVSMRGVSVLFSGDPGHADSPVMAPPEDPPATDFVVVESTYGNRSRDRSDAETALAEVIGRTVARGGSVIIPAFAVGRTQLLLHLLKRLQDSRRIPALPVFLDSPLAINATDVFADHPDDHRLSNAEAEAACALPRYIRDVDESRALDHDPMPKIIIAGSGMASGGRVLHHLKVYAPDSRNTILFTGFQAGGTRGAAMVAGAGTIKIHGQYWPVEAEVQNLEMLSAHADAGEIIEWLGAMPQRPRRVFVVHGEPDAADTLRKRIQEQLGWLAEVPEYGQRFDLADDLAGHEYD